MLKVCIREFCELSSTEGGEGQQCVNLKPFSAIKKSNSYLFLKLLGLCFPFPSGTCYCWDKSIKIWAESVWIYCTVILFKLIFQTKIYLCHCNGTNTFAHLMLACLLLDPHLENFSSGLIINRVQIWFLAAMEGSFNEECSQQSLRFSV